MSISSFTGIETALRGLIASQDAIQTTGENIANADTPGYTRQTVDLVESPALAVISGTGKQMQLGTGVDASQINRIRDQFLDVQYRAQNTTSSGASTSSQVLQQIQNALGEPSSNGLSTQLQAFWSAWGDVANSPNDPAARQALIGRAQTLVNSFNSLDSQFAGVQGAAATQYATLTAANGQVAQDAQRIAALNGAIGQAVASGSSPNTLMDQRDQLIDDLSGLAKVSVSDTGHGQVQVNFGDASTPLVSGTTATWPQTMTSAAGGKLGALLATGSPGGQVAGYRATLDGIASGLINAVNSLHTSTAFFSGNSASTIAVAINASQVQTSSTGAAGGNDVATAIAALANGSSDKSYAAFVATVGNDVQSQNATQQTAQAVMQNVSNQRQSVSGVSLDEEMSHLITFQRGYQASARMMTTVDSMLDTLINHTGTVGL